MRRMIRSSISVSSERFTNGSTSCSRVLMTVRIAECGLRSSIGAIGRGASTRTPQPAFRNRPFLCRSWDRHLINYIRNDAVGGQPVARGVRPEPDAVPENVGRQILDVFRVDLGATPHEQRPHL